MINFRGVGTNLNIFLCFNVYTTGSSNSPLLNNSPRVTCPFPDPLTGAHLPKYFIQELVATLAIYYIKFVVCRLVVLQFKKGLIS